MTTLREVSSVRQVAGENSRRWFTSTTMDLFIWCSEVGTLVGFQFTYDKEKQERALTWKYGAGFVHDAVDDGEDFSKSRYKATPLLLADGRPNIDQIVDLLVKAGVSVPPEIIASVTAKIREYP